MTIYGASDGEVLAYYAGRAMLEQAAAQLDSTWPPTLRNPDDHSFSSATAIHPRALMPSVAPPKPQSETTFQPF